MKNQSKTFQNILEISADNQALSINRFDTKYVGQKEGYTVENQAFINKRICGCGLTTFILTQKFENVIVLVPTNNLIYNKTKQISGLLAVNSQTTDQEIADYIKYKRAGQIKIISTYDSLYRIEHLIGKCRVLVDEVQSFFKNYNDKTDIKTARNLYRTTLSILEKHKEYVTFVSATPIDVKYFPEWVRQLKQIEYEFEVTYRKQPVLVKTANPLRELAEGIILPIIKDGQVTVAGKSFKKCLIFINSISDVKKIVSDYGIDPSLCGMYCGDTVENDARLKEMEITRITGLWDLKQFSFVTSSGWAGCDFYDTEAMTIIVSNTNRNYTMVDINTDLMQAVSRLRNSDNPNRDKYIFIYNQTVFTKSEQELLSWVEEKKSDLLDNCELMNDPTSKRGNIRSVMKDADFKRFCYQENGKWIIDEFQFNTLVYEIKEVRNKFLKGFDFSIDESEIFVSLTGKQTGITYKQVLNKIINEEELTIEEKASKWYKMILSYYNTFGKYTADQRFCENHLKTRDVSDELIALVKQNFRFVKQIDRNQAKTRLQNIYNELGIKRTAKATDLCELLDCRIQTVWDNGVSVKKIIFK